MVTNKISRADSGTLLPKDYIVTEEGLYFAVVLHGIAGRPVHCSLRYIRAQDGSLSKVDTEQAFEYLQKFHPHFIGYSEYLDTRTILIPVDRIAGIYKPGESLNKIERSCGNDKIKQTAVAAIELFARNGIRRDVLGITGSLLLNSHNTDSDIDIVIYDPDAFRHARNVIKDSMDGNDIRPLDESAWRETHHRRDCALNLDDYKKHEIRKYNKFILHGIRIDISYVPLQEDRGYTPPVKKLGPSTVRGRVIDDSRIFDYPARYIIDNREIQHLRCYTATYTGQAFAGEHIEASGMLERDAEGRQFLIIGTSREAADEYIKVTGSRNLFQTPAGYPPAE